MKTVEYSQIVRRKLKNLKARLTREFGAEVSGKSVKQITVGGSNDELLY